MGFATPYSIKVKVIEEWIQGLSRDKICQNNGIGTGTVTSILQQVKTNIADIDLLRGLALKIKKENLDLNYFASTVRLKKVMDELEISEEKVESLLEEINTHCFKKEIDSKEFVSKIDEVSKLVNTLDVSLFNIPSYIDKMIKQLAELEKRIMIKQGQINQKIREHKITIDDLNEYRLKRPILVKIDTLEFRVSKKEEENQSLKEEILNYKAKILALNSSKSVLESEFTNANKKLSANNPLDITELSKIADEIFYHPNRYIEIIKIMREHFISKPIGKK
jgi:chromosome segregation ATPase